MINFKRLGHKLFILLISALLVVLLAHSGTSEVLQIGQEGAAVAELQKNLKSRSLYRGPIDGYYGEETRTAVRLFEKQTDKLTADGIAGSQTRNLLSKAIPVSTSLEFTPWISSSLAMDSLAIGVATSGGVIAVADSIEKSKRRHMQKVPGGRYTIHCGTLNHSFDTDEGYISIEVYDLKLCEYVLKTKFSIDFGKGGTIGKLNPGNYQVTIRGKYEGRKFTDEKNFQV